MKVQSVTMVFLLLTAAAAAATVPAQMSYQGVLTDAGGVPVASGNYTVTFRVYDVDEGGAPLWVETHLVPVTGGVFSVVLGSVAPLSLAFDRTYYVGVSVDVGAEFSPRRKLTASAYSLNARNIDNGVAVRSINGLRDLVSIVGAGNVAVAQQGNTLTISSSGSGGGTSAGTTLDQAYDQGGAGSGRVITADAGPVHVKGADGLIVDGKVGIGIANPESPLEVYSNEVYAVYGETKANIDAGAGVFGVLNNANAGGGASGVIGVAVNQSALTNGVWGDHASIGIGVFGSAVDGFGVAGLAYGTDTENVGIYGESRATGLGWAGYMYGDLGVVGQIYTGGGSAMLIDHPLDPERRLLQHPSVNSPEMMNVYNGNVVLGDVGEATVDLPDYFEALNGDYRYQLTAIGAGAPDLHVADEIQDNRFRIAGGRPGMKVSWMVTGVRHDAQAMALDRTPVREKAPAVVGSYFNPEARGVARSLSTLYATHPQMLQRMRDGIRARPRHPATAP